MVQDVKYAVGLMSGTSLDGLDLVLASFSEVSGHWDFSIHKAETRPYSVRVRKELSDAPLLTGEKLIALHKSYGKHLGEQVNDFLKDCKIRPHLIASHGHTIFHQPARGITFQLGDGNTLSAVTGLPVVFDFRSLDVALGGQGAPLVPVGDRLLFPEYTYCLNLGGFANVSFETDVGRIAYDPCPANLPMAYIMKSVGKEYDKDGRNGKKGKVDPVLLKCLNELEYYRDPPPKSLGREWLESFFYPCLDRMTLSIEDKLRTVYEHIITQICHSVNASSSDKILVTGGGAHNKFLMDLFKEKCPAEIVIPENEMIDFKEALIFAFLGVLRLKEKPNCLASVTGAKKDSSSGVLVITD